MKGERKFLGSLEFYLKDGMFICEPICVEKGISTGFYIDETIPFKSMESAEKTIGGRLVMELGILLLHAGTSIPEIVTLNEEGF